MKTPNTVLTLLLSIIVFCSCSQESDDIEIYNEVSEKINCSTLNCLENNVLNVVNEYRVSKDLSQLKTFEIVSVEADSHTNYMIENGKISHDNFDKRQEYLVENAGAKKVGENVAFGYDSAEDVLAAWLNNPSHKALIENPHYTHFGVSVDTGKTGKNYFTQIFIKR